MLTHAHARTHAHAHTRTHTHTRTRTRTRTHVYCSKLADSILLIFCTNLLLTKGYYLIEIAFLGLFDRIGGFLAVLGDFWHRNQFSFTLLEISRLDSIDILHEFRGHCMLLSNLNCFFFCKIVLVDFYAVFGG